MRAILGKKLGMTTYFTEAGKSVPVTVVEAGPCYVTQVKTEESDGYNAIQIGYDEKNEKQTTGAMMGHFKKAGVTPKRKLVEIRDFELEASVGDSLSVDIFEAGEKVSVVGTSKGKGFQGVVRRHGFGGVGMATHGQHNRMRHAGSIGAASYPSKVMKGMRMGGRMGNDRVKTKSLRIEKIMPEDNIMLIKGAIPGAKGSYVIVEK